MEKYIGKKYKLKSSENFEEYLKFIARDFWSTDIGQKALLKKLQPILTSGQKPGLGLDTLSRISRPPPKLLLVRLLVHWNYFQEVGLFSRKLVTSLSPVVVLTKNDDGSYSLTMTTPIRKVVTTFKLGEEFSEDRPDGIKVISVMQVEGDNLTQIQIESNGRKSTHVREFTDTLLTVITTAEGWDGKCIRIYELIE